MMEGGSFKALLAKLPHITQFSMSPRGLFFFGQLVLWQSGMKKGVGVYAASHFHGGTDGSAKKEDKFRETHHTATRFAACE